MPRRILFAHVVNFFAALWSRQEEDPADCSSARAELAQAPAGAVDNRLEIPAVILLRSTARSSPWSCAFRSRRDPAILESLQGRR